MPEYRSRLSRRKRILFAAALVLVPLLFLEFLFRFLGIFGPDDPFSIVRDDRGVELIQYNWNEIKPRFPPEKTPGTLRVMVFGESSALGFPYQPRSSFGEMLRTMLESSLPGLRVEMINLGRVAMNSAEVVELMPDALGYHPDLVIVYSGHNEFLSLRNPAYAMNWLDRRVGRFRVVRAAGRGLKLGVGAVLLLATAVNGDETPLAPPVPKRVSGPDFDHVVQHYRQNLEAMAAACKQQKIPLVLNTLTSNLAGWPPEFRVFPPGIAEEARDQAREAVAMARAFGNQGHALPGSSLREGEAKVLATLAQARKQAPGYAPLTYWLALLEFDRFLAAPKLSDPPENNLAPFNQALSEEAHTVIVHRSPPELNAVVRETAEKEGLWLAENEWMSVTREYFDDHCHPNLAGQAEIAKRIYDALKAQNFPRPRPEWSPGGFDLPAFEAGHRIDADFRAYVRIRLGIYLGLERDLPFRSELTRRQLREAIAADPADPLPALLLAAVDLHYGDSQNAAAALRPWARKPDRLRLALDRYFTRAADLRDGTVLFYIEPDPTLPPLRGLLTSGIVDKNKSNLRLTEPKPRAYYNAAIRLR